MFELTFSPEIIDFLEAQYSRAEGILEYGSGGSSVLGLSLKKQLAAVESDQEWLNRLKEYLVSLDLISNFRGIYSDIGPTKEWGHPLKSGKNFQKFPSYALLPWQTMNYAPDTILIDGRFRVACFIASATMTKRPVTILFDDYLDRPQYHVIEEVFAKEYSVGRMGIFNVQPNSISAQRLCDFIPYFINAA